MPGCVANTLHSYKEDMPRPTLSTLLTQNSKSLDHENRFFEDTKKRMNETLIYTEEVRAQPQYSDKKALASKVTSREFIQMPETNIPVPKGYREGRVQNKSYSKAPGKQTRKQVSEVDEQGA